MRVIVLSWSPHGNAADPRSDALLVERARRIGATAEICHASREDGTRLDVARRDVVLPRADLRSVRELEWFASLVRRAEWAGARCLPSSRGLLAAEDKVRTARRLKRAQVLQPETVAVGDIGHLPSDFVRGLAKLAFEDVGGRPAIVKPAVEWGGQGQFRCDDATALTGALEWFRTAGSTFVVQAFIEHVRSVTVLVAGGCALSAWEQRKTPGTEPATSSLDPETADAAIRATAACGLAFASVDFLDRGDGSPLLCVDVNSMPGLWPDDPDDIAFADAMIGCVMVRR